MTGSNPFITAVDRAWPLCYNSLVVDDVTQRLRFVCIIKRSFLMKCWHSNSNFKLVSAYGFIWQLTNIGSGSDLTPHRPSSLIIVGGVSAALLTKPRGLRSHFIDYKNGKVAQFMISTVNLEKMRGFLFNEITVVMWKNQHFITHAFIFCVWCPEVWNVSIYVETY